MKITSLIISMTMNFKDRVERDINKVFLNNKHFGSEMDVGGKVMPVTIDEDALKERNLALIKDGKLHTDDVLFYCNKKDFSGKIPHVEQRLSFGRAQYLVTSVKDDMGMLTITLRSYRGR